MNHRTAEVTVCVSPRRKGSTYFYALSSRRCPALSLRDGHNIKPQLSLEEPVL